MMPSRRASICQLYPLAMGSLVWLWSRYALQLSAYWAPWLRRAFIGAPTTQSLANCEASPEQPASGQPPSVTTTNASFTPEVQAGFRCSNAISVPQLKRVWRVIDAKRTSTGFQRKREFDPKETSSWRDPVLNITIEVSSFAGRNYPRQIAGWPRN